MEIDLYKELTAFSTLTPEQQSQELERLAALEVTTEPEAAAGQAGEDPVTAVAGTGPVFGVTGPLAITGSLVASIPDDMVNCSECGSRADGRDLFCVACGSFLEAQEPARKTAATSACADCGSLVEPGEVFCPSCGAIV